MKINKKSYKSVPLNFNTVCKLEEMGVSLQDMDKAVMSTLRAYLSLCMDTDRETAGNELEKHLVNGGSMDELLEALNQAVEDSGFFQALSKPTETNATKDTKTEKQVQKK